MEKYLKNKKIGEKLRISFGGIIAAFLITVIIAVVSITVINSKMSDFYNRQYKISQAQMEVRKNVQVVGKQILWSTTTDSAEETAAHISEAETYAGEVYAGVQTVTENCTATDLTAQLDEAVTNLGQIRKEVMEYASNNQNQEALALYNTDYNDATELLQDILVEIGTYADNAAGSAYKSAAAWGNIAMAVVIVLGVICVTFCIYIGILLTKSIKKPIEELEVAAGKLSKGELDAEVSHVSGDELGNLADSFRTAFAFMQAVIQDVGYLMGELADGNFTIRTQNADKYIGDFEEVLNSIRILRDKLDDTMVQINEGSDQVSLGAEQMAESAQSLAEGATEQAGAIEELTATVENVNEMAQQSAQSASHAANSTLEATHEAEAGKQRMQELVSAMENISSVSMEIQNIIGSIEDDCISDKSVVPECFYRGSKGRRGRQGLCSSCRPDRKAGSRQCSVSSGNKRID